MNSAKTKNYAQRRCEIGAQLKTAREDSGQSIAEIATQLRTMQSLIERLESGDWESIGPGTYGRGFARSYARLLDVSLGQLDDCLEPPPEADVDVQAAAQARRRRLGMLRMQRFATYTAATALIGIPLVFFIATAFRGQISGSFGGTDEQPVLASLVPANRSQDGLVLTAAEATEVMVMGANGATVWSGEIGPNQSRHFDVSAGVVVRFENPDGIAATLHGKPLALAPYRIQQAIELRIPASDSTTDRPR